MKEVKIEISCRCETCNGAGIVQGPEWAEFWKQPNAHDLMRDPDQSKIEAWFEARGEMRWSAPYMGKRVKLFPEEEIMCPDCEGAKRQTKSITIEELAEMVFEHQPEMGLAEKVAIASSARRFLK